MDYAAAFRALIADPRYQKNIEWGEPRSGHPEGTVSAHIAELEANLELLFVPLWRGELLKSRASLTQSEAQLTESDYWKLKLLIHSHDTFKAESKSGVAISHPASHASLARAFLAEYCDDADLLEMVQFHDEPFALWRQVQTKGACDTERMTALLNRISDWGLFLAFLIIDGCTEGKSRESLVWFFKELEGRVSSRFSAADIIS